MNSPLTITGARVLSLAPREDHRGTFTETYRSDWLRDFAIAQVNRAERHAGTLTGLHWHKHQADLWHVVNGVARVVLHDLRADSPSSGRTWCYTVRSGADPCCLYIPPGVAHGFAALGEVTLMYFVDRLHDPADEFGVAWDDPEIGADWGLIDPVLSERDKKNPTRRELPPVRVP